MELAHRSAEGDLTMSEKPNDGGPAFPHDVGRGPGGFPECEEGMSTRTWLAGQSGREARDLLDTYCGNDWMGSCFADAVKKLAETKLAIADALLAELEK